MLLTYLAYGSNMSTARLRARVPSARAIGTVVLREYQLRFHKRGTDGSAKCDAFHTGDPEDHLLGVLFTMDDGDKPSLDRAEGLGAGYDIATVEAETPHGEHVAAFTYIATDLDDSLVPFDWYLNHVLRGALDHGLPRQYCDALRTVPTMTDPDTARAEREQAIHS